MKKKRLIPGKVIFALVLLVFLWLVVTYFAQTKHIVVVLTSGKWYWIALAAVCQLIYYPFYAYFVEHVFSIFDVDFNYRKIIPIYLASKFTDVALPIATLGQVAVFVRNGKKHDISPVNVGIGISFVMVFVLSAFSLLSLFSIIIMLIFGEWRSYIMVALIILIAFVALAVLFIIRLSLIKKPLNKAFLWLIRIAAKLVGQGSVEMKEIDKIFQEIGVDLRAHKDKIWPGLLLALMTHFINIATFAFIYLAFAGQLDMMAVLAGYVSGLLFTIVSITPQGVGVAEAVMITTLHSFGLDIPTAAVITLAFRGLLYWLPFFPGFYVFSHLELSEEV